MQQTKRKLQKIFNLPCSIKALYCEYIKLTKPTIHCDKCFNRTSCHFILVHISSSLRSGFLVFRLVEIIASYKTNIFIMIDVEYGSTSTAFAQQTLFLLNLPSSIKILCVWHSLTFKYLILKLFTVCLYISKNVVLVHYFSKPFKLPDFFARILRLTELCYVMLCYIKWPPFHYECPSIWPDFTPLNFLLGLLKNQL